MVVQYNKIRETSVAGTTATTYVNSSRSVMQVLYGEVILTTANSSIVMRRPIVEVMDEASASFAKVSSAQNQAANLARNWLFAQGVERESALTGTSVVVGMPMEFVIPQGWSFKISIENALATDAYDAKFLLSRRG